MGKSNTSVGLRIDPSQCSSITQAVQMLNSGALHCPVGICIVYSSNQRAYFLLARPDKKREAVQIAREEFQVTVKVDDQEEQPVIQRQAPNSSAPGFARSPRSKSGVHID